MKIPFTCLLFMLMSCAINSTKEKHSKAFPKDSENIKYLALGDSYTIGEGVYEKDRFPNQIVSSLESKYKIELKIIARTGWTSAELLNTIKSDKNQTENYDLVTLLIGVNDEFRAYAEEDFTSNLNELIEKAITYTKNAPQKVILISIPDYGVTDFGKVKNENKEISKRIDLFNEVIKESAQKYHVKFIDIIEISRDLQNNEQFLASDGLHPSGKQYAKWVENLIPEVKEILNQ